MVVVASLQVPCPVGLELLLLKQATLLRLPCEEAACLPDEIRPALGERVPGWCPTGRLPLALLPDGDLTDTVSGPRSTASDPTSSKASTKSPSQRHNPFSEDQAEAVSSPDTTPVHTTSQEKGESHIHDLLDPCTELEVIRSAGQGPQRRWVSTPVSILSTVASLFSSRTLGPT